MKIIFCLLFLLQQFYFINNQLISPVYNCQTTSGSFTFYYFGYNNRNLPRIIPNGPLNQ